MDKILIIDFGSQYTQLIARRIRELNVYSEIQPYNISLAEVESFQPAGIILSGGPMSVYDDNAPMIKMALLELGCPILGICYGMQLIALLLGGSVSHSLAREYGYANIAVHDDRYLFEEIVAPGGNLDVWMSHGDRIDELPRGFRILAGTPNAPLAAIADHDRKIYGVQFHPEVAHTTRGKKILANFVFKICNCTPSWNMGSFVEEAVELIKQKVKDAKVICALSGGVDSSVTAMLVHRAIGDRLQCFFIDNGLLRLNEAQKVTELFKEKFHLPVTLVDAKERFLSKLKYVIDPEEKRKIIGREFIAVFEEAASRLKGIRFLAQGTLYPDVIESVSVKGPSATIKSHHNVGGLPEVMKLELIEPLRYLFKDEVRKVALKLGLDRSIALRQPFPGPGLAVRILGEVTDERIKILQHADDIIVGEIKAAGLYYELWQAFGVLLPIKTVGVMGDERSYENVIAIRAVRSDDGMTADWAQLPYNLLGRISNRIINEVKGVNRVVYDISSKPPATIEWE